MIVPILHLFVSRLKGYFGAVSILLIATVFCQSCEEENTQPTQNITEEGSWLIYSPIDWTHDGEPITGTYCKVYSDEASIQLKLQCLEFADTMFAEIMSLFGINSFSELALPPENEKINVYVNVGHKDNIAYAYWGTIFITVRTSELNTLLYEYLFKHELTHEFEFMIEGTVNLGTDVWFREAIAIYNGGGFYRIMTEEDLNDWIIENENVPGQGNPVMIHEWSDFPTGADIDRYYWYAFDISMRYLLSPLGLNKKHVDVLNLFYDIRDGHSFDTAFLNNFGIELKTFEDEFYDRIREYLNKMNEDPCIARL